jgi:CRP/FNR family transcriptional regulator
MKKPQHSCDLNSCLLCRHCIPEWKTAIQVHRKNLHFKKGTRIFSEGDPVHGIFFVFEGAVKVHKRWGEDKELIIRFAREGDIFGHRGFSRETLYPVSATAIEPLTTCYIDMSFFQASLRTNPTFLYELLLFFADELHLSEQKMRDLAHMPVKGRVARALFELKEKFGADGNGALRLQVTRQDLASMVGAAYETVFRIMNELTEDGSLRVNGKDIFLADESRLRGHTQSIG